MRYVYSNSNVKLNFICNYSQLPCMYVYIGFKKFFYVVRHLTSIASYLPTGLHLSTLLSLILHVARKFMFVSCKVFPLFSTNLIVMTQNVLFFHSITCYVFRAEFITSISHQSPVVLVRLFCDSIFSISESPIIITCCLGHYYYVLYVQVTVHRDKLRIKQTTRYVKYPTFILP